MTLTETSTQPEKGILTPEFIAERDVYYTDVPKGAIVVGGCSDERDQTPESAEVIAKAFPEAMPLSEGMLRVFGDEIGLAMAVLVAGGVTNPGIVQQLGGISGTIEQVQKRARVGKIVSLKHSDAAKEGNPSDLDPTLVDADGKPAPVGCAFATLAGLTSELTVNNEVVRTLAERRQADIYGPGNHTDLLLASQENLLEYGTDGKGSAFAVTRKDYAKDEKPTLILQGKKHALVADTGVIFNFTNQVASPAKANVAGKDFYSVDVVPAVKSLMEMFPEIDLDPQLLAEALTLQSYSVCAALEAGDPEHRGGPNDLNPARLATGVRGNVAEALAELQKLR